MKFRPSPPSVSKRDADDKLSLGRVFFRSIRFSGGEMPPVAGAFPPNRRVMTGHFPCVGRRAQSASCPKKTRMARLVWARIELISVIGASFAVTY